MLKSPLVLGVSGFPTGQLSQAVAANLSTLGFNTGNLLFSDALLASLTGAARAGYHFTPSELEGRDAIVIAAANWFNEFDDFGFLAQACERTNLPVFLVGLGAQPTEGSAIPKIKDGTERLLRLVADRSQAISVRGPFSAEALESLGLSNVFVTGCPSLLLAGSEAPDIRTPSSFAPDDITIHATRHMFGPASLLQRYLYRQAWFMQSDLLLQSELTEIFVALCKEGDPQVPSHARSVTLDTFGSDRPKELWAYLKEHSRVFSNLTEWTDYQRTKQFCFGTRFHGTIASLLAGTASVLVTHDTRTEEMAEVMKIPAIRGEDIDRSRDMVISQYFSSEDLVRFKLGYTNYRNNFLSFFSKNILDVAG